MPTKHFPYVSEAGHRLCEGDLEIEQSAPAPETPCCFRHLVARLLPRAIRASCLILVDLFIAAQHPWIVFWRLAISVL